MLITITGPTASGKTPLAAHLAHRLGSEVISADSRQVYRGMDLGTGKDLDDYVVEGQAIAYHLIDILPAGSRYHLYAYQHDFHRVYADLCARGIEHPILCGGTGLYIESVLRGYHLPDVPADEALRASLSGLSHAELRQRLEAYGPLHATSDLDTAQRTIRAIEIAEFLKRARAADPERTEFAPIESLIVCLDLSREARRARISARLERRLAEGMTSEVERLLDSGVSAEDLLYYGLEYRWVTEYVLGRITYEEMARGLETAIHQFAKRQMTWFRGMERRGFRLHYIDALAPMADKVDAILTLLHRETSNA